MARLFITPFKSGIYYIIDENNCKKYVGSSANLKHRRHQHFSSLRKNTHSNPQLQACYNKKHKIKFVIVEYCQEEELLIREQEYLERMWDNGITCFNVSPEATRNINSIKTFDIILIDPNGNEHGPIVGLCAFARKHGLYKENLSALIKGRAKSCKGWVVKNEKSKRPQSTTKKFAFLSPDGKQYSNIGNLTEFAEKFGLCFSGFSKLTRGKLHTYHGWRLHG